MPSACRNTRRPSAAELEQYLFADSPFYPELEIAKLTTSLQFFLL